MFKQQIVNVSTQNQPVNSIREVEMEVIFGTPSKNCVGAGVCTMLSRLPRDREIPCPHARAAIHWIPDQELVFRFRKSNLTDWIVQRYFSSGWFVVEESFFIPYRLVRRWNLQHYEVPPGLYLVEEYSTEWRLYFPIR